MLLMARDKQPLKLFLPKQPLKLFWIINISYINFLNSFLLNIQGEIITYSWAINLETSRAVSPITDYLLLIFEKIKMCLFV